MAHMPSEQGDELREMYLGITHKHSAHLFHACVDYAAQKDATPKEALAHFAVIVAKEYDRIMTLVLEKRTHELLSQPLTIKCNRECNRECPLTSKD